MLETNVKINYVLKCDICKERRPPYEDVGEAIDKAQEMDLIAWTESRPSPCTK